MNSLFLILSCIVFKANTKFDRKFETQSQIRDWCTRDLIYEVFDHESKSSSCTEETLAQLPELLTKKSGSAEEPINHLDFLSYALYPKGMDNFIATQREFSDEYKRTTNMVSSKSIQFYLGTRDHGRTLLIYFPGTANIADVKIDITVKHHSVSLPGIVDKKWTYNDPNDPASGKLSREKIHSRKVFDFRVHQGIHKRLWDAEIQVAIQQILLFLYSGEEEMKPIFWEYWCKRHKIDEDLKEILERCGFNKLKQTLARMAGHAGLEAYYTDPEAMDLQSEQWMKFVSDAEVTKEDIVTVTTAIHNTKETRLKNARVGMRATKVENLIISGHSLGAGYATYFFLRLYGDGYTRKAPGFHLLPDDPAQVTVIPFAAPNVVYFEDVKRIKASIVSRILNVWNYGDPVPIIMNGLKHETKENVDLGLSAIFKFNSDAELIQLGTNQPIGNILILMTGEKRIRVSPSEDKRRRKRAKKKFLGIKIHGYKNWKHSDVEETWFKIIPYVNVGPYAKNAVYYAKQGAKCLWKNTKGGVLGAIGGGLKKHPMKKYRKAIIHSCLKDYLNEHSAYWKSFVEKRLAEERAEEEQGVGSRFKELFDRFGRKKRFEKEYEQKVSPERQMSWLPWKRKRKRRLVDVMDEDNVVKELLGNDVGDGGFGGFYGGGL